MNNTSNIWGRCDVCGKFVKIKAAKDDYTKKTEYSIESYVTLCEKHSDTNRKWNFCNENINASHSSNSGLIDVCL